MYHELFGSAADMLAPAAISALLKTRIDDVQMVPFRSADALSGANFAGITTNGGRGPRLVLKRFSIETDWIMRALDDRRGRAVRVWEYGLLDCLPPELVHGYRGCARDGAGWAILMDDLGPALVPSGDDQISIEQNTRLLDGMASLHVRFWDQVGECDPALGLSTLELDYTTLAPATAEREADGNDPVPKLLVSGWELLLTAVEPEIADMLLSLASNPSPLCRRLRAFPQTVVHADWKLGNLGLLPAPPRVVVLDWARVLPGPPVVDLGWYLAVNSARLPVAKEVAIEWYRQCLEMRLGARLDEQSWHEQLELGLVGSFLQLGWSKALGAVRGNTEAERQREQAELDWWCERVRPAIQRL